LLEYAHRPGLISLVAGGRRLDLPLINMRFSWRLYLSNNILRLLWTALWTRALPRSWRDGIRRRRPCLRAIQEAGAIAAISGGDSFSDIYGLRRFFYVVLPQVLILWMGRPLVLLPQTYGPYRSRLARGLGGYVLRHASRVYSRDRTGMEVVRGLAGERNGAVRFAHDLGFALEPEPPSAARVEWVERLKTAGPLVGLNVSGLLYCGGYTGGNMFSLKTDYAELVQKLLRQLLAQEPASVILVPHVFGGSMENDAEACRKVHEQLPAELKARVHTVEGRWSAGEIKHLIGRCDFFIGSRMHACIAALSQGVPAAGLAYSRKFAGVFEAVDVADLVFDLAELPGEEVVKGVTRAFEMRQSYAARLQARLPEVRINHRSIFAKGS
jgi:polysaccharide pyruvyl transferase WcaK-like protein